MEILETLRALNACFGPSGQEGAVAEAIRNIAAPYVDECTVDTLGNLLCHKKGKGPKVLFAAHMDEVGFIITYIEESGLLRFDAVGGVDTRVVIGKRVRLESGVPGVVGAKPIHLQSAADRDAVLEYDKLYIDIGAASREEILPPLPPAFMPTAGERLPPRRWTTAWGASCCLSCCTNLSPTTSPWPSPPRRRSAGRRATRPLP